METGYNKITRLRTEELMQAKPSKLTIIEDKTMSICFESILYEI